MAGIPRLLMLVGAATPPGRLAAAITAAAEAVRGDSGDIDVDVMNLAETAIDTCDGRPLAGYGAETRGAVDRIAAAAAVLIAAPVYRASFPGVLKNLLDIVPVEAPQQHHQRPRQLDQILACGFRGQRAIKEIRAG